MPATLAQRRITARGASAVQLPQLVEREKYKRSAISFYLPRAGAIVSSSA
jgi:hypothetical protein